MSIDHSDESSDIAPRNNPQYPIMRLGEVPATLEILAYALREGRRTAPETRLICDIVERTETSQRSISRTNVMEIFTMLDVLQKSPEPYMAGYLPACDSAVFSALSNANQTLAPRPKMDGTHRYDEPIVDILGSKSRQNLLATFFDRPHGDWNIKLLSQASAVSEHGMRPHLELLEGYGIVSLEAGIRGPEVRITVNYNSEGFGALNALNETLIDNIFRDMD